MIQSFKDRFLGPNVPNERRIFNILQLISIVGLSFTILLVYIYIPNRVVFYFSVGNVILAMLTFVEANRILKIRFPAIVMSAFFNFIFLSMVFIYYGRIVCMIPVYFIFGLLYSVLMIEGKLGFIFAVAQTFFYLILIIYGNSIHVLAGREPEGNLYDYSGVLIAIIVTGIFGGLAVKYKIQIQDEEKDKIKKLHSQMAKDYMSKDIFMINISHEIRTPMNAIVGTVNLLLDTNVNDRVRDSAYNILNSCNALLSITNELMDVSNSESQNEFNIVKYDFYDMLMEIVNMMSIRLMDSSVEFYFEVTKSVPRFMYSDPSKIRHLIVNILNNAVKYTHTGMIILRVDAEKIDEENTKLLFEVEDTGVGMNEDEIKELFHVYDNIHKFGSDSLGIKGSGLGLTICKEILDNLNGEIHVNSKYNVGSIFYFSFPQKSDESKLISLNETQNFHVLLYERDSVSLNHLMKIFDELNIPYICPKNDEELSNMISTHKYTHLFIAYECYMNCIKFLDNGIVSEKLIVISNMSQTVTINTYGNIITRPANALNICTTLSNENNTYVHEIISSGGFTCPDAKILVVDDNLTNLTVASGLMKKYKATIITALSGNECLNILENQKVDIIFLDYMMPEMNGIDTLIKIREMEEYKTLPVIALTANVVNGAKEMFLQAGFDYFIPKPIEMNRIERVFKTFLPRDLIVINNRN